MIIPILLNEKTEHSSGELCAWAQNQLVVEQGLHRRGPWGLTKQQVTARQGESLCGRAAAIQLSVTSWSLSSLSPLLSLCASPAFGGSSHTGADTPLWW